MKRILTSFAFVAASLAFAQVSIAPSEVTPEATLDIRAIDDGSTPDGILIPRVTKAKAESMPTPEKSTLVYINEQDVTTTIPRATKTTDVDAEGFYYFKDGKWVKLGGASAPATQTWRDIRTAPNATGIEGGIHKVSTNGENIPATAFLVITDLTGQTSLRLPDPADEAIEPGKMIVVSKIGTGSTAVLDHDGITGHAPGGKLLNDGSVIAFRGKLFITDGEFWYALNY